MSGIKQPITQVRLTNVAIVRFKSHGKRFEVACYKNKILNWRSGIEKDISEVLQSFHIFVNVSKGEIAKQTDLTAIFHTNDTLAIAKVILDKGEIQVSEKERNADIEAKFRDIASIITEKCLNPLTNKPYPQRMIENGMRNVHYSVKMNRSAKSQALEVMRMLKEVMPIERAQMRAKFIIVDKGAGLVTDKSEEFTTQVQSTILPHLSSVESERRINNDEYEYVALMDPGSYRVIEEAIASLNKNATNNSMIRIEILDLKVSNDDTKGDEDEEGSDMSRLNTQYSQMNLSTSKGTPSLPTKSDKESDEATATIDEDDSTKNKKKKPAKPAGKKSKARVRDDDEEIRTVGAPRELVEEDEVEDSAFARQKQQQEQRRKKKERKAKLKSTKSKSESGSGSDNDND